MHIVLTGGGTGGHVVPNLAIADAIADATNPGNKSKFKFANNSGKTTKSKRPTKSKKTEGRAEAKAQITYIGSKNGIEVELTKRSGIPFEKIQTGKLRRYFDLRNFVDVFRIPVGVVQAFFKLARLKPDVIFSKGGFVGFPVVVAGWARRIPVIIHESDAIPGLATKLSAPFAKKILLGFKDAALELKKYEAKTETVGNPVRAEIFKGSLSKAKKLTGFKGEKPVLLVMGGSGGAQQINEIVKKEKARLVEIFDVIHITGKGKGHKKQSKSYCSFPYIYDEMKDIYALASLALSRAGANSIAELEVLQIPTLLYPLGRFASRGDQMANTQSVLRSSKIFQLADEGKEAHSQLIMLPKRPKKTLQNTATKRIAEIILTCAEKA